MTLAQAPTPRSWQVQRERIDLAEVVTTLLGPAPGRRGAGLWWRCPFGLHEDRNPSFQVSPGKPWWKCFGCGERGDAVSLLMRLKGMTFPEAVAQLVGRQPSALSESGRTSHQRQTARGHLAPASGNPDAPPAIPSGMTQEEAVALVEASALRLRTPEGAPAMDALRRRGLHPTTIQAARLGWTPPVLTRTRDGRPYRAGGILVPWFSRGVLALLKARQAAGRGPKYVELYRNPTCPPLLYPGPEAIRPGWPLVVAEGEFDAFVLGQALRGRAGAITLGSASSRPDPVVLGMMLSASPWFIATDADPAGNAAAERWPQSARRVCPPGPHKDWCDAAADAPGTRGTAVNLERWWSEVLAGNPCPRLYTIEELAAWRWGPALEDSDS